MPFPEALTADLISRTSTRSAFRSNRVNSDLSMALISSKRLSKGTISAGISVFVGFTGLSEALATENEPNVTRKHQDIKFCFFHEILVLKESSEFTDF
jgi:hypothetical protein